MNQPNLRVPFLIDDGLGRGYANIVLPERMAPAARVRRLVPGRSCTALGTRGARA